jgi:hypothetical protein
MPFTSERPKIVIKNDGSKLEKTLIPVVLSVLFIHPICAMQYASCAFYDDECYGTAQTPTFAMDFLRNTNLYTFLGGHFIDVGRDTTLQLPTLTSAELVNYGTGYHTIEFGLDSTQFVGWCAPCDDVPTAKCQNACL